MTKKTMTVEEAIEILKSKMDGHTDTSYEWVETVRMAINALELVNKISKRDIERFNEMEYTEGYNKGWEEGRRALKKEIIEWLKKVTVTDGITFKTGFKQILRDIETMSSVIPQQQWIPINDETDLPKDKHLWVTHRNASGYCYVDELSWDMTEWSDYIDDVVAYMEYNMPEPYEEEAE